MKHTIITILLLIGMISSNAQYNMSMYKISTKSNLTLYSNDTWSDYLILYSGIAVTFASVSYVNNNLDKYSVHDMNMTALTCITGTVLTYALNTQIRKYRSSHSHRIKKRYSRYY